MIKGLRISQEVLWTDEAWIGHGIIAAIAREVGESDADRFAAEQLEIALRNRTCQEVNLSSWNQSQYGAFCRAAALACRMQRSRGAAAWYEPESFPVYMDAFKELLALLREDPRCMPATMDITFRDVFDGLQKLLERDRAWQREGRIPKD